MRNRNGASFKHGFMMMVGESWHATKAWYSIGCRSDVCGHSSTGNGYFLEQGRGYAFFPLSMWTLGAATAFENSSVTTQPFRTLTTSAGRKQATQMPPR